MRKIIKIEQGDDNLLVVLFKSHLKGYDVIVYRYVNGEFHYVEQNHYNNKSRALRKFKRIVEEF